MYYRSMNKTFEPYVKVRFSNYHTNSEVLAPVTLGMFGDISGWNISGTPELIPEGWVVDDVVVTTHLIVAGEHPEMGGFVARIGADWTFDDYCYVIPRVGDMKLVHVGEILNLEEVWVIA